MDQWLSVTYSSASHPHTLDGGLQVWQAGGCVAASSGVQGTRVSTHRLSLHQQEAESQQQLPPKAGENCRERRYTLSSFWRSRSSPLLQEAFLDFCSHWSHLPQRSHCTHRSSCTRNTFCKAYDVMSHRCPKKIPASLRAVRRLLCFSPTSHKTGPPLMKNKTHTKKMQISRNSLMASSHIRVDFPKCVESNYHRK